MRYHASILTACLLSACAGSPPKPPEVVGDYRPINRTEAPIPASTKQGERSINFSFEGDILEALDALRELQPLLRVSPPLGKSSPLPVRVEVRGATLDEALQAIAGQAGPLADVVFTATPGHGGGLAFIRFRANTSHGKQGKSK